MSETFMAVRDILRDTRLADFQCVDFVKMLLHKSHILVYEPGMGKTYVAAALIRGLLNERPSRRVIYVGKANQLSQTPKDLKKLTGLRVAASSAAGDDITRIFRQQDFLSYPILMLSHTLLADEKFMDFFYDYKDYYDAVILDEVHDIANFPESTSGAMARAMLRHFDIRYGLTATPVTKDPAQLVRLAHMFDWNAIDDVRDFIRDVKRDVNITEYVPDLFTFRDRLSEGISGNYRSHVEEVEPHTHQVGATGSVEMFEKTKGPGAVNQAQRVYDIWQKHNGLRGLVFVHYKQSVQWLTDFLTHRGLRIAVIVGKTTRAERDQILEKYANREYDLLLTSVTTALNIDSEYAIFYEYVGDIKQMVGRAERGLNPKTLDLYFIFTLETGEADYFIRNMYNVYFWIQRVLSQDYSTLVRVGQTLKSRGDYNAKKLHG